jgi:hypothetical protein
MENNRSSHGVMECRSWDPFDGTVRQRIARTRARTLPVSPQGRQLSLWCKVQTHVTSSRVFVLRTGSLHSSRHDEVKALGIEAIVRMHLTPL